MTTGHGTDELVARFQAEHDDYNKIMTQALADRLAEAFAEFLHRQARLQWGYGKEEADLSNDDLIREKYRGIRPAPGYPACPDHTEKPGLFRLLDVEKRPGITLTESNAMHPASSVSGWYFGHPDAKYFAVGKLERDQVADYAARKAMPLDAGGTLARAVSQLRPGESLRRHRLPQGEGWLSERATDFPGLAPANRHCWPNTE